jgi:hypothetical protein
VEDRRSHLRHPVTVPVAVADDTVSWPGLTADISRSGARIETDALVREGEFVYLSLDGDEKAIGWVVRELAAEDDVTREIVVQFRQPLPDSLESLVTDLDLFYGPLDPPAETAKA